MKNLFLMIVGLIFLSSGQCLAASIATIDPHSLDPAHALELRSHYIDFMKSIEKEAPAEAKNFFKNFEWIQSADAALVGKICFFAGWQSDIRGGVCAIPPEAKSSNCAANEFECNKALFPKGTQGACVPRKQAAYDGITKSCEDNTDDLTKYSADQMNALRKGLGAIADNIDAFCEKNTYDACQVLSDQIGKLGGVKLADYSAAPAKDPKKQSAKVDPDSMAPNDIRSCSNFLKTYGIHIKPSDLLKACSENPAVHSVANANNLTNFANFASEQHLTYALVQEDLKEHLQNDVNYLAKYPADSVNQSMVGLQDVYKDWYQSDDFKSKFKTMSKDIAPLTPKQSQDIIESKRTAINSVCEKIRDADKSYVDQSDLKAALKKSIEDLMALDVIKPIRNEVYKKLLNDDGNTSSYETCKKGKAVLKEDLSLGTLTDTFIAKTKKDFPGYGKLNKFSETNPNKVLDYYMGADNDGNNRHRFFNAAINDLKPEERASAAAYLCLHQRDTRPPAPAASGAPATAGNASD